jgi:Helix-turn-helix
VTKVRKGYIGYDSPGIRGRPRRRILEVFGKSGGRKTIELAPEPPLEAIVPRTWGIISSQQVVDLLIQARKAKHVPAAHVAEMMGVNPVIVYRLEGNERDIKLSTALRYAKALGLDFQLVEPRPLKSVYRDHP